MKKKGQLSGIRDVDRVILSKVDDRELLTVCSIDRNTWNTVCDDPFLKRRILGKYKEIEKYKSKKESWKHFFLRAVNYIALIKEEFDYEYTFGDFKKQCVLLKKYNKNFDELLMESATFGELALVIWSLKNGANIHAYSDLAFRLASQEGHLEVVKYLIEHRADIRANNDDALRSASENGRLEVVKYLVEHGSNIHAENDYALRWASRNGHYEVVRYLVEHGANIHIQNDKALRWASENGQLEVVRYLVEHGANIHVINDL